MEYIKLDPQKKNDYKPLWSVVIPTYNCADFLEETLISVLKQDPGEEKMELIVVDDFSTKDDPKAVVDDLGKGRVQFIQQEENVGKVRNYETGIQASKGTLIHLLHGDDKVRPGFYASMTKVFNEHKSAQAAFCRSIYIDSNNVWQRLTGIEKQDSGILENAFERLVSKQIIQTPSMVVRRNVYEEIGLFDRRFDCLEDWEMWIRIAYHFKIAFVNEVLAEYRIHENNATSNTILSGELIETHKLLISIIAQDYQDKLSKSLLKRLKRAHADFFLQTANDERLPGKVVKSLKRYALKLSMNLKTILRLKESYFKF